jgi:hypothetical protein
LKFRRSKLNFISINKHGNFKVILFNLRLLINIIYMALCCNKMFSFAKEMHVYKLINFSIFTPPRPTYNIIDSNFNNDYGQCYKKVKFIHQDSSDIHYHYLDIECHLLRKVVDKKKIVLLYIKNQSKKQNNLTIIFSHSGSSDLGLIYPFLIDLSTQLKVIFK